MPDAYVKQTWIDGVAGGTPISAARLAYIEDGIENATLEEGVYVDPRTGGLDPQAPAYAAIPDGIRVTDGAITTDVLTCATSAPFTSAHVGKAISVGGAAGLGQPLVTTIAEFTSTSVVRLSTAATQTVTNAIVSFGTNNYAALNSVFQAAATGPVKRVTLHGSYYIQGGQFDLLDVEGWEVLGVGQARIFQGSGSTRVFRVGGNSSEVRILKVELYGPHSRADNRTGNAAGIVFGSDIVAHPGAITKDVEVAYCHIEGFRHAGILTYGAGFGSANPQRIENVKIHHNTIYDTATGVFFYKNTHGASIEDNHFTDTWDGSIALDTKAASDAEGTVAGTDVVIKGNIIDNPGRVGLSANVYGVLVKGAWSGVVISNNVVRDVAIDVTNPGIKGYGVFTSSDADNSPNTDVVIANNSFINISGSLVGPGSRSVTDAETTVGVTTLISDQANFTNADVGARVVGVGIVLPETYIDTVVDERTVTLNLAAEITGTAQTVSIETVSVSYGMSVNNTQSVVISNNVIKDVLKNGIYARSILNLTMTGNVVRNTGTSTVDYPILVTGDPSGTQSTGVSIANNQLYKGTGASLYSIFCSQASNVAIGDNPTDCVNGLYRGTIVGLRATLRASVAWDPPSLSNLSVTVKDVTVAGAQIGDGVVAALDTIGVNSYILTATVRELNLVRAVLVNFNGASHDLNAGTLYVIVMTK